MQLADNFKRVNYCTAAVNSIKYYHSRIINLINFKSNKNHMCLRSLYCFNTFKVEYFSE